MGFLWDYILGFSKEVVHCSPGFANFWSLFLCLVLLKGLLLLFAVFVSLKNGPC